MENLLSIRESKRLEDNSFKGKVFKSIYIGYMMWNLFILYLSYGFK